MHTVIYFLLHMGRQLRRENMHKAALGATVLLLAAAGAFSYFEKAGFWDSLWWAVVTMTTVGYGDISPATFGGRVAGVILMLMGIGLLGVFTATIASIFVENRMLENKGMKRIDAENHFAICGWNDQGEGVIQELLADAKLEGRSIVILANLDEKPVGDDRVLFLRGELNDKNMEQACLQKASTAILLSDTNVEAAYRDAKAVMDVLNIKTYNPDLYLCVELAEATNIEHVHRAGADEVIVAGEFRGHLLAQAALDHGITELISELVSNRKGSEFYKVSPPAALVGKTFLDALVAMKEEQNTICLGVQTGSEGRVLTNPDSTYIIEENDQLLVVASSRTNWT